MDFFVNGEERHMGSGGEISQAAAAKPENPYQTPKYVSFLWSSGGEETCYILDYTSGND